MSNTLRVEAMKWWRSEYPSTIATAVSKHTPQYSDIPFKNFTGRMIEEVYVLLKENNFQL